MIPEPASRFLKMFMTKIMINMSRYPTQRHRTHRRETPLALSPTLERTDGWRAAGRCALFWTDSFGFGKELWTLLIVPLKRTIEWAEAGNLSRNRHDFVMTGKYMCCQDVCLLILHRCLTTCLEIGNLQQPSFLGRPNSNCDFWVIDFCHLNHCISKG